jgi:hypothetical protein
MVTPGRLWSRSLRVDPTDFLEGHRTCSFIHSPLSYHCVPGSADATKNKTGTLCLQELWKGREDEERK